MKRALFVTLACCLCACGGTPTTDGGAGGGFGGSGGGAGGGAGGGTAGGSGGGATGGGGGSGKALGTDCGGDGECASGLCHATYPGLSSVCTVPCSQQSDCSGAPNLFCNPRPDAGTGVCVPRSPAHCFDCTQDSQCGVTSEVCTRTAMDPNRACHIDCSLAGSAACPPEYVCQSEQVDGGARRLCVPTNATCPNSGGGYCDRLTAGQPCSVSGDGGTCSGLRYCAGGMRFDTCLTPVPTCRLDCAAPSQAGCMEAACPSAVTTPDNCGACGTACPGLGRPFADVTCANPACTFACRGEQYDVDNTPDSGCEVADAPMGNHTTATAIGQGSFGCNDGSSMLSMAGLVPSDTRAHQNPAVAGFSATVGAAPDFFSVVGTGGTFCTNDVTLTLTVTGASQLNCYRLDVTTDRGAYTCSTNTAGTCLIDPGSGSYSGDTTLAFQVRKTCPAATRARASYTLTGHL